MSDIVQSVSAFFASAFPVTVVVAISLFGLRECLEHRRRQTNNNRKLRALKKLLAADCERNKWALEKLGEQARLAQELHNEPENLSVESMHNGMLRLAVRSGEDWTTSAPIWPIHQKLVSDHLTEMAGLDPELFELMLKLSAALSEMVHVRDSLIQHVLERSVALITFGEYATEEIDEAMKCMALVYEACTGDSEIPRRIR